MKTLLRQFRPWPLDRRIGPHMVAVATVFGAGTAAAADFSIGVGVGTDRGHVECAGAFPCDRSSSHGKLFAAYRINDAVDMQAVIFDAGRFKGGDEEDRLHVNCVVDPVGRKELAVAAAAVARERDCSFDVAPAGADADADAEVGGCRRAGTPQRRGGDQVGADAAA